MTDTVSSLSAAEAPTRGMGRRGRFAVLEKRAAGRPASKARIARRGAAVVEMAICVPVFFLVVLALIEFSRMLQIQHTVRQAALEGARAGLTLDGTVTSATSAATAITSSIGIISPTITVSPNPMAYTAPTIQVTVSADPAQNGWLLRFFTAGHPVSGTITMSREIQAISAQ